jgi:hypothetical protein
MGAQMKCNREGGKLVFTFEDGIAAIVFDSAAATVSHDDAAMHGYEQKIRDNAAIARKQKDGTVITVTEAMRAAAIQEMVTHLTTSTDWNMRKSAVAKIDPNIQAIADKRGTTYAEAMAWFNAKLMAELEAE